MGESYCIISIHPLELVNLEEHYARTILAYFVLWGSISYCELQVYMFSWGFGKIQIAFK